MVSVIFPAAGQGKRMGLGFNKIFTEISGNPILIQTLLAFSRCESVDELIVVVDINEMDIIRKVLNKVPKLKPFKLVAGGSERQYSVYNGLMAINPDTDIVLVHDAARPLISKTVIQNVINEAMISGSAVCAVPVKDTIAETNDLGFIDNVPDRNKVWAVQTPQGFKKEILIKAHQKAQEDNFLGTDEASLVRRIPHPVKLVMGDYNNLKVTTPTDLIIAEMLFSKKVTESAQIKISSLFGELFNKITK